MLLNIQNQQIEIEKPMRLEDIIKTYDSNQSIYAGIVDGKLCELTYRIEKNTSIEWVKKDSMIGKQIYERTLTFVFIVAVKQLFKNANIHIEFTFQDGLYCSIQKNESLTPQDVNKIKQKMLEIIHKKAKITRHILPKNQAIDFLKKNHLEDKADLLQYRSKDTCSIYEMEGIYDYFYGFMLPDASYLHDISLQFFAPGLRLGRYDVTFQHYKLFQVMKEYEEWGKLIDVANVAKMNEKIMNGQTNELMLMSEAMIEKKLSELASYIAKEKEHLKMILIAGPSSAGKTTFSKRLGIHLKILGMDPITISMDDFYLNRTQTPRLLDGSYDFENIEAIDLKLFNETMLQLIHHKPVYLPHYHFQTGLREYNQQPTVLSPRQILIIEGIHGLNPRTSYYIPENMKMKIYINALTHLNYDNHNRIPTSDYRLIRRIARDYQFRNADATETIRRWKNVQKGEEQYIYPYQEQADVIFNTSMVYELAILKPIVQKLLLQVSPKEKEYIEAHRLYKLLDYFIAAKVDVPQISILAEFIGNSIFQE